MTPPRLSHGQKRSSCNTPVYDIGVGPAPPETVALCVRLVARMGTAEVDSLERRTFAQWDRASLGDLWRAIERRRRELSA